MTSPAHWSRCTSPGRVTGKLTLTSHNLRCLPETEDEAKGSVFWWLRPIAMASVDTDLTFFPQNKEVTIEKGTEGYDTKNGRELKLRAEECAFGTFERAWALSPPHKTISHNWILWGKAGRYSIHLIWMMGRPAEEAVLSGSCRLYYDGELVCCAERVVASTSETGRDQEEEGAYFYPRVYPWRWCNGCFPTQKCRASNPFQSRRQQLVGSLSFAIRGSGTKCLLGPETKCYWSYAVYCYGLWRACRVWREREGARGWWVVG